MRRAALLAGIAALSLPCVAWAQRASENAVSSADDAFGSSVGLESTGIYSEADTRGFSPSKAGNARIDGIYYDPVGGLSARLRQGNVVRVGFAAEDYPFQAPTGIIEYRFKPFPDKWGVSPGWNTMGFGGHIAELDIRAPIVPGKLAFLGGAAHSDLRSTDGSGNRAYGFTARFIARLGTVEIAPFGSVAWFNEDVNHTLVQVTGDKLPKLPQVRRFLGQEWAVGYRRNHQMGVTGKAALSRSLSLRAGLFYAEGTRQRNFSEIFTLQPEADAQGEFNARHLFIADPRQALHSLSGEAQLGWRFGSGRWQHRLIAGFRARRRVTESGGSDIRNLGTVRYGDPDPEPEFAPVFRQPNRGELRQSSIMLGYSGKLDGIGSIELGLQKARYRATFFDAALGRTTTSRDDPWLYNATLRLNLTPHLSFYIGTQKGLEDSGAAPENALNRNEQLPATKATQYEGGLRWKFQGGQLAVNAFQITKPYFTFAGDGNPATPDPFVQLGNVRHRGVEASLSGRFGKRLNLVAGVIAMKPRVAGGLRPAGTPSLFARLDANYRTDIFGGLTPTVALIYTGSRVLSPQGFASLGGRQLAVPGYATVDLGLRQQFHIGKTPLSFRAVVVNAFDAASWKVVAANTVYPEERRRFNLTLAADF